MTGLGRAEQAEGALVPPGPHFIHCYIYEGQHCSCGGNYQGDQPGPEIDARSLPDTQEQP